MDAMAADIEMVLPYLTWESGTVPYLQLVATFTLWLTLYIISRIIWSHQSPEYCCRIITFLHGSTVTSIAAFIHFYLGSIPWECNDDENLPIHNVVFLLSLGYFLFDLSWCCLVGSESATMLAHHVVSIAGFSYATYAHKYGAEVTAVCLGAEITNPMVQFRWFLKHHGYYNTVVGRLNDYLFVASFGFWRFIPGSYLLYCLLCCDKVETPMKVGAVSLYIISIAFMYGVVMFFLRKYVWKISRSHDKNE